MTRRSDRIVIIGGGIIGAMTAWELVSAGCEVTIVEREEMGAGCSHGNCGFIAPSHALPLAQPGAMLKTLKAMTRRNSPFSVKPRWSSQALRWFWNFSRCCNRANMLEGAVGIDQLLQWSQQLYHELLDGGTFDVVWQKKGLLLVFANQREFEDHAKTATLLRQSFGIEATRYDQEALLNLEPALKRVVAGGWHYENDCHLRPDQLMAQLKIKLVERGVRLIEHVAIERLHPASDNARQIDSVSGSGITLAADQFVMATGAWTPFFNRALGCQIPIEPGKGYSITMPAPERMPRIPMIFEETHVAVTPMGDKYRIGSMMEFSGYDTSIQQKRIRLLRASAEYYLHDPMGDPIEETWYGWRPMTWDSKPIIDRSPAYENVWICAGHGMLGMSMATGSGRLVRNLVLGETPPIDPSHYAISRFR